MKSAGALLLDLSGSNTLGSKLQRILETATIRRADAGLIFLISRSEALAGAHNIIAALKRIVPEIPAIVALEDCNSAQAFELLNAGATDLSRRRFSRSMCCCE